MSDLFDEIVKKVYSNFSKIKYQKGVSMPSEKRLNECVVTYKDQETPALYVILDNGGVFEEQADNVFKATNGRLYVHCVKSDFKLYPSDEQPAYVQVVKE
jgi:transketolase N-terminal domain/subunit